tara:strand:+ start:1116 stop:1358 length:243 start_codon:yes stop_codon:yes gene_type:complete
MGGWLGWLLLIARLSMKVSNLVKHRCGNCAYRRPVSVKVGFCTVYDRDTLLEDKCRHFSNIGTPGGLQEIKDLIKREDEE